METESEDQVLIEFPGGEGHGVEIRKEGTKFRLREREMEAVTHFPLRIDAETNQMSVVTPKGEVVVKTLPAKAIDNMLNSGIADKIREVELIENEVKETEEAEPLIYKIKATRKKRLFGLIPINIPVETSIGVSSGEVISTSQSFFFRATDFLFR